LDVDPGRWQAGLEELLSRVAGRFGRVEPRRRARAFVLGLLADLPRKNFLDLPVGEIRCTTQARPRRGDGCLAVSARGEGWPASPSPSSIPTMAPRTARPTTRSSEGWSAHSPGDALRDQAQSRAWASRVARAGSSAARASQAAPPTSERAGRTGPANRTGSSARRVVPTRGRLAGQAPGEDDRRGLVPVPDPAQGGEQRGRGPLDDRPRLRVAVPVGGGDQRGERRQLHPRTRVHRLDHPVEPPVEPAPSLRRRDLVDRPVRVQLAQH
jgi:hypothetical protein